MEDYRISVKGLVIDGEKFLILEQKSSIGSIWTFPGGRVEPGESPEETLNREVLEEIACKIKIIRPMGYYWAVGTNSKRWVCCVTYLCEISSGEIDITKNPDGGKITKYRWVTKEEFLTDEYRVADGTIKDFVRKET